MRSQRYAYPGDEKLPQAELVVLDVAEGTVSRAQAEPALMANVADHDQIGVVGGERLGGVLPQPAPRPAHAHLESAGTGDWQGHHGLSETGATRVEPNQWPTEPPIVRVLAGEVLWYSQRDGLGHLLPIPPAHRHAAWPGHLRAMGGAADFLHVDEAVRVVYFTTSGLVKSDPYRRAVCRVNLDGSGFAKVTDDELDHIVTMPDNHEYFIDSASTVDTPPAATVRDWPGGCWSS